MKKDKIKGCVVIDNVKLPEVPYIYISEHFAEKNRLGFMTRTEAIEKMARKRFEAEYGKRWEETTDEYRGAFLKTAETMLDALLEGGCQE